MEEKTYILIDDDSEDERSHKQTAVAPGSMTGNSIDVDFSLESDDNTSFSRSKSKFNDISNSGNEVFAGMNNPEFGQPPAKFENSLPFDGPSTINLPLNDPPLSTDSRFYGHNNVDSALTQPLPQQSFYAIPLPNFQVSKCDTTKNLSSQNTIFEKSVRQKFEMFVKAVGLSTLNMNRLLEEFVQFSSKAEFPAESFFLLPDYKYINARIASQQFSTEFNFTSIDRDNESPIQFFIVSDESEPSLSNNEEDEDDVIMLNS